MIIETVCVLEHRRDEDRPRRAVTGLYACAGCRKRLAMELLELPGMYEQLAAAHGVRSGGHSEIRAGGHAGLTLSDHVVRARAEIRNMLASHCRGLAEDHRFALPADTVPAMADYLLGHRLATLDLLLAQPDADDFAAGIDAVHRDAFGVLYPRGQRRIPVAPCRAPLWCDVPSRITYTCSGALVVTFRGGDRDRFPDAVCDECGREVPPVQWRRLVDGDIRLTALELAELWSIPLRTVQNWAGRDEWVTDGGRPARYSVADAERSLPGYQPKVGAL